MTWLLVFVLYTNPLSSHALMNTNTIAGFKTERECQDAAARVERMAGYAGRQVVFTCVTQGK